MCFLDPGANGEFPIAAPSMWTRKDLKHFKDSLRKDADSSIKVGSGETVTVSSGSSTSSTHSYHPHPHPYHYYPLAFLLPCLSITLFTHPYHYHPHIPVIHIHIIHTFLSLPSLAFSSPITSVALCNIPARTHHSQSLPSTKSACTGI